MKQIVLFILTTALLAPMAGRAQCERGAYGARDGDFVVVVPLAAGGDRYLFRDGRRGKIADAASPLECLDRAVSVRIDANRTEQWALLVTQHTDVTFSSAGTRLAGQLIEPARAKERPPLVVMVHGSERTPAIGSSYPYVLAAQGIAVFVYDKRGTGASEGEYTQNFELLADDAAAALEQARRMTADRVGRAGYFGGSQGGWVAPLAATRSRADFVAVGFGLVASPIDEDREQMLAEAKAHNAGPEAAALIDRLSKATARLLLSDFEHGYEELARARRELAAKPWGHGIAGEYSGEMVRTSDAQLRRIGRARFDNLELIWDYDSSAVLEKLNVPLLWVLAGEDREAPIGTTRAVLTNLAKKKPIDLYLFPDTDHGMVEFTTNADGSRTSTRITNGYFRLLADWIKQDSSGPYGRAERLSRPR